MKNFFALCAVALAVASDASAQTAKASSLASLSTQPSMNVFRRFSVGAEKMTGFYGDMLGLKALPLLRMPGGGSMILFQVGTGQVKLQATPAAAEYASGAVREVTGLRVLTFFFPDEAALTARFVQHGHPAPQFQPTPAGRRAMVQDPENQWVELVVMSGAPSSVYDAMEVGLTVSDLEKSRAFYRDFVGLDELAPVRDALLGVTKYPFRHGTTTVNVWSFGPTPRANTRSAGIQYVVSDVEAVDAKAKAQAIKIDTPLGNFSAGLRTIWLSDPDGITNYFAQIVRNPQSTGASSR
ncbi:MAG TPA: VOC family protein [Vicinamibacterales bacterium]|nr:VOC family protein [Vicinamibacterales bacterium]